jgi:hypothetical protein
MIYAKKYDLVYNGLTYRIKITNSHRVFYIFKFTTVDWYDNGSQFNRVWEEQYKDPAKSKLKSLISQYNAEHEWEVVGS